MAKFIPIASDSGAFKVLMLLAKLGGRASMMELMPALWSGHQSPLRFRQVAATPLQERGFIQKAKSDAVYELTAEGSLFVKRYDASIAQARMTPSMTSILDPRRYLSRGPMRPGADDYRNCPSIVGDERVPYHNQNEGRGS